MSQENVEIVRRTFEAFQEGLERDDPGAVFDTAAMVADAKWIPHSGFPGPPSYRGREEFVEFWRTWTEDFEEYSVETEQLIEAPGNRVVGLIRQSATGKGSGAPIEARTATVYELEGGHVVRMRSYLDPAEALEAAGLRE